MAAILPGYEYDVFISYRQNDNRSGWVSEFVKDLREELATIVKFPVSVYYDSNPHDGLLDTHSVDRTLESKLKCLIFIPVLSQTYCDPLSFAWSHEFLAFRNRASNDRYTLNLQLSNGNIASRILPIRIHDLDQTDQNLFESEIGGALRGVDFIFRSAGVNRPLRSKDDDVKEISHMLFYRDQINKTANAIRELLVAFERPSTETQDSKILLSTTTKEVPGAPGRVGVAIAGFLIIALGTYFHETLGPIPESSPSVTIINIVNVILFLGIVTSLFYFLNLWKNRRTRIPSKRNEMILVVVAAFLFLLVAAGIINSWSSTKEEGKIPRTPWLFMFLFAFGPSLYYWIARSKKSKVILTAAVLSIIAMAIHATATDYFALAILLIVTSILYYFTIPGTPLKGTRLAIFAWIFSVFVMTVFLLFSKDIVTALTIILIAGPVVYYFIANE